MLCFFNEVRGMALYDAVEIQDGKICKLLVDEDGFVLYNSCEESLVIT
jgi:hypothetical protein